MALTKNQRIEIQESARFNYMRRLREQEDKAELQAAIDARIKESTRKLEEDTVKKGK